MGAKRIKSSCWIVMGMLSVSFACTGGGGGGGGGMPADPSNIICASGDACLDVSWDASPDAGVGYRVYYHAEGGAFGQPVQAGTDAHYRIDGLVNGMEYTVRVTAERRGHESPGVTAAGVPMHFAVGTALVTAGDSTGPDDPHSAAAWETVFKYAECRSRPSAPPGKPHRVV